MGLFSKIKKITTKEGKTSTSSKDIYEDLGVVKPFTALENEQMRSFVGDLSGCEKLNESERQAFKSLWRAICIDIDSFGNNIWNLDEGHFTTYDKDGIKAEFKKVSSKDIDDDEYFEQGRVTFTFKSKEGNIVVTQHERNKIIFLVYVSEDISERLYDIFREVEAEILKIKLKKENQLSQYKVEIEQRVPLSRESGMETKAIDKKEGIEVCD